jgi:chromosome segregation ATPase
MHFIKILRKNQEKKCSVEYNPGNIENVLRKFDQLTEYINNLERSLKAAENKTLAYEDILQKYERIFKEEITLYRLHKSNISVLSKTFNENELFIHEIQDQIKNYVESDVDAKAKTEKVTTFKRILSRFFHQNELHKFRVQQKINELNETIEQKNRLLERMHGEIETWYNHVNSPFVANQQITMKQACGL